MSTFNSKVAHNAKPKKRKKTKKRVIPKGAICITLGEQSENHAGMLKQGNGLAAKGYSIDEMLLIKDQFDNMGGISEWYNLKELGLKEENIDYVDDAAVLVMRSGVDVLLRNAIIDKIKEEKEKNKWSETEFELVKNALYNTEKKTGAKAIMKELTKFEWDKIYWDTRRSKWLNKRARYNVCFGKEQKQLDRDAKSGTIIAYNLVPRMAIWKSEMEKLIGEKHLEGEGNYYYDVNKCYIGWHGDGERKKVAAANFSDDGVVREINWKWFKNSKSIGNKISVLLNNGDCYIMSEKASGYDWKKKVKIIEKDGKKQKVALATLRHAAAVQGSKMLNI